MSGNLHCFSPHIFPCEVIRNVSTKQDDRSTGFIDVPTWIYSAIYLIYSAILAEADLGLLQHPDGALCDNS